jgi:hypothetical protein
LIFPFPLFFKIDDNIWVNAVLRLSLKTFVYFGWAALRLIGRFVWHNEAIGDNFGHAFMVAVFILAQTGLGLAFWANVAALSALARDCLPALQSLVWPSRSK